MKFAREIAEHHIGAGEGFERDKVMSPERQNKAGTLACA